eukprot:TRINITY_DN9897_c0_g1_i1.p1 TRINITY_DN9897_c0_g1~~TRINITY_DN9897_c0_g1_i1.p1  ORF type:complete len:1516 (-),score=261.84 TRINITY_DN9897_c0_g1_i1:25-4167(-)
MCMQTLLTRCMGHVDTWNKHFETAARLGFNAIHFTPPQQLGASGSSYSLFDQLALSDINFGSIAESERETRLAVELKRMEEEFGLLGFVDIVLNHTANNSPWLSEHPEATYNLRTAPYLNPAFLVDQALRKLSLDLRNGVYRESHGVDGNIRSEHDLHQVVTILRESVLPSLRLWEFYTVNVEQALAEFKEEVTKHPAETPSALFTGSEIDVMKKEGLVRDPRWGRFSVKPNIKWAIKLFGVVRNRPGDRHGVAECCRDYQKALDIINLPLYEQVNDHINAICRNVADRLRYERLASHGPQFGPLSEEHPLVEPYFTPIMRNDQVYTWCINNGWIWGGNPLENFASSPGFAYLRRDVIIWSDSVKLRYGKGPEECPWLWKRMREYVQRMAKNFHGLRIDNCHSTPLHVARYLIDSAREVRPNIFIMAELFTGNERYDNIFIAKLGINALIREAMSANDSHELGRLCHRYGGEPVGSIVRFYPPVYYDEKGVSADIILPAKPGTPPAVFFDCTHDNEPPTQKRTAQDTLPNAAAVWAAGCPVASTFGYDLIIPKHVPVTEHRLYPLFAEKQNDGIMKARKILNELHQRLSGQGYTEIHIHQEGELITIQRHNPRTHRAAYFIVHSAFSRNYSNDHPAPVRIPGRITQVLLAGRIETVQDASRWAPHETHVTGLASELRLWKADADGLIAPLFSLEPMTSEVGNTIIWESFPPGSVVVLETVLPAPAEAAIKHLSLLDTDNVRLQSMFASLSLSDFNGLLYCCDAEEKTHSGGSRGVYDVPRHGPLTYAGLQGWVSVLDDIRVDNNMGHPLFDNLRAGDWAMDFISGRLSTWPRLAAIQSWLVDNFGAAKLLPRHLIPKYFDKIVMKLYLSARQFITRHLMADFIWKTEDGFVRDLAMTAAQMVGDLAPVPLLSAALVGSERCLKTTMAAGLPHFSTGYMRAWGRDTFIALPGLLLVTGRFGEAREIILGFASSLRHGLIPNLLDSGFNPRYNCRDACWWFLQALQEYCTICPDGYKILQDQVVRLFPADDTVHDPANPHRSTAPLADIVQEIMQRHANGIQFRERNAGYQIDSLMQDRGFNVSIRFDQETGFIAGGNEFNCGTWMDKMGNSEMAHNRGVPATPRDGADVEIIGLVKSAVRWLTQASASGKYPYKGVEIKKADGTSLQLPFADWNTLVQENFEKYFWVPTDPKLDSKYKVETRYIHKRGIYKDTHGSHSNFSDYQLRPNYLVAMAVAPELFSAEKATRAIEVAEKYLLAPVGMRTLDPNDRQYRPNYDSGNMSDDYFTSGGYNYHNGPEWVWPVGFLLRAKLAFAPEKVRPSVLADMMQRLTRRHREIIRSSHWRGLPELTNENGSPCYSSCATQAWSSATILQAYFDLYTK